MPSRLLLTTTLLATLATSATATGLFRNGAGGRATALGGSGVAGVSTPLAAMQTNPALLAAGNHVALELGYFGAHADADFTNAVNRRVGLSTRNGHGAELALAHPFAEGRGSLALSLIPETTVVGDWHYLDTPGGLDGSVSYGFQRHRSRFVAVRGAVGGAWRLDDDLALGASLGVVHHEVDLQVPYIFQTTPGLAGFKTLLDLETSGQSWNGELGLHWRLDERLSLGLRYRSPTSLAGEGRALGDASTQLAALGPAPADASFRFDSKIDLSLPDIFSAGLAWRARPDTTVFAQLDWIPWSRHFDNLRVQLAGPAPNLGLDAAVDSVPLRWKDRFNYRLGVEHRLDPCWTLRAGYVFAPSPIPTRFVTPLNGAIAEHTLAAGLGYRRGPWTLDLGYQLDLRRTERVARSGYLAGEYSDSELSLLTHWWSLSLTRRF